MKKNSAPGPDGFTAKFFMDNWELVGESSIDAIFLLRQQKLHVHPYECYCLLADSKSGRSR